ncbi:MAG: hypothetical protein IKJ43_00030 [Bacilli bacterium]|nr:hypothetical protein [Bacilli bacterium]
MIDNIYNMHIDILNNNLYVHPIILNKDSHPLTIIDGNPYILFQINIINEKISIEDIIPFTQLQVEGNNNNWSELWSKKNDYLEFQISELGKNHPLIRDSFSYFIGLGETAIAIVNNIDVQNHETVYAHNRITDNSFNLYDPTNIIKDLKVRDVAEYFKYKIFKGINIEEELTIYLNASKLSIYEYMMFFARMIYPTPYFDLYEEIITDKIDENNIKELINNIEYYENTIKKIYHYYKTFINIMPIEWLD